MNVCPCVSVCLLVYLFVSLCTEEIDVVGSSSSSQDASIDSDADDADDAVLSANKAFTSSLRLSLRRAL